MQTFRKHRTALSATAGLSLSFLLLLLAVLICTDFFVPKFFEITTLYTGMRLLSQLYSITCYYSTVCQQYGPQLTENLSTNLVKT